MHTLFIMVVAASVSMAPAPRTQGAAQPSVASSSSASAPRKPALPPGHPSGARPAALPGATENATTPADPKDVGAVDDVIRAYFESISGPAGQPRDWPRFRTLFLPRARFLTRRIAHGRGAIISISIDDFVRSNNAYFEKGGYFETETKRETKSFAGVAQVFSAYEARRGVATSAPYLMGVDGFQLVNDGQRWWIVNIVWDWRRPGDQSPLDTTINGGGAH